MAAVRFVAGKGAKHPFGTLQLACHVKPGASSKREGILAVTDNTIELAVSAQAKDGEANKAVRELLAEVSSKRFRDIKIPYKSEAFGKILHRSFSRNT